MADNPFTAPTISGYNASPPPDDGSQSSDNELTWAKHLTKIGNPLKTLIETTITNVTTAFASTINTGNDQNNAMGGSLAFTSSELTIATGAITATRSRHSVDTESDASTDDLDTITATSVSTGAILILSAENAGRTVVVKHSTGNILLADDGDFSLDDADKRLALEYDGTNWKEFARAPGTSPASQAEMETGTSTSVATTPGRQHFHASAAKAWSSYNFPSGTPTVRGAAEYNVSSYDDNGTGNTGVNFTNAMSSSNFCAVSGGVTTNGSTTNIGRNVLVYQFATTSVEVMSHNGTALTDNELNNVVVYGDL